MLAMDINNYSKSFDCCGKSYYIDLEIVRNNYYIALYKRDKQFKEEHFVNELFGKGENNWNKLNKIHYLFNLMEMMYLEKKRDKNRYDLGLQTEVKDALWYRDNYNLECIRKTLRCIGIDILPLLALIDLNYIIQYDDGIDYMAITPQSYGPNFRVKQ